MHNMLMAVQWSSGKHIWLWSGHEGPVGGAKVSQHDRCDMSSEFIWAALAQRSCGQSNRH